MPWNSRCAICIVRSEEKPSLRLASCCSVDVVNGGDGRLLNGFSSTLVTVQGRRRISVSRKPCASFSPSSRTLFEVELALAVEILAGGDALPADFGERGAELGCAAAQLGFEIPVTRGAERETLFFTLDDQRAPPHSARGPR